MTAPSPGEELPVLFGRDTLSCLPCKLLNRGRARNPDVLLVEVGGRPVVIKDFAPRGRLVRATIGRWITRREMRAYRALAGQRAVPQLLGRIDALAFAVEYRPGRRMSRRLAAELAPGFVDRLAAAVEAMHAVGVVHLDLRHRSNVLVDEHGDPVLIDFASAVRLPPGGLLARTIGRWLGHLDRRAVAKWRQRLEPGSGAAGTASASSGARRGASRPT